MTEDGNVVMAESGGGGMFVCTNEHTWSFSKSYNAIYRDVLWSVRLEWSRSNFSEFCIQLLSSLEGLPYNDKKRPSFGRIFDNIEFKKGIQQSDKPQSNLPFLEIKCVNDDATGEWFSVKYEKNVCLIQFWVEASNTGEAEAIISDDRFKTKCCLPVGGKAIKPCKASLTLKDSDDAENKISQLISNGTEGLILPYRLAYYPSDREKEFYSIEVKVRIFGSSAEIQ